jgi:hypothetical protein
MLYGWLSLRVAAGIMSLAGMVLLFPQPSLHESSDPPDIVKQS